MIAIFISRDYSSRIDPDFNASFTNPNNKNLQPLIYKQRLANGDHVNYLIEVVTSEYIIFHEMNKITPKLKRKTKQ